MNHRRIAAAAAAIVLVAGLGATQVASADTATPVDLRLQRDYWACVAVDHVEVGACVENPLPDLSGMPTVPDTLNRLLRSLPAS